MDIRIVPPDQQQLTKQAEGALSVAQAYQITDAVTYRLAADERREINARIATLDEQRKSITRPLDEAKQKIMDLFRRPIEVLTQARQTIDTEMLSYDQEQERIRREAEEKARREQEEARRKAREAEEKARRQAEEAARRAQEAADEEGRLRAEQDATYAAQRAEEAAAQRADIDTAPAPIVAPTTPRVAGVSTRSTWRGECTDYEALVIGVGAPLILKWMRQNKKQSLTIEDLQAFGQAPITLTKLDQTALNSSARGLKGAMNYPGCRAVEDKGLASRRSA